MINLLVKDKTVSLDVNPAFDRAVPVLKTAWAMLGLECVVTSGKDGVHSLKSAHYHGDALDLRLHGIKDHMMLFVFGSNLANALRLVCGPGFYVVHEPLKFHFHLEYSLGVPNIKGFKVGKMFYDAAGKVA